MITLANEVWQIEPNTNSLFHPTFLSYDHPFPNGLHFLKTDLFREHNPSLTALVIPATAFSSPVNSTEKEGIASNRCLPLFLQPEIATNIH